MSSIGNKGSAKASVERRKSRERRRSSTTTATFDDVIQCLLHPSFLAYGPNLLLLITPLTTLASTAYTLHIIDRNSGYLLSSRHITAATLRCMERSDAFQHHNIVVGSSPVDFSTVAEQKRVIAHLLKTIDKGSEFGNGGGSGGGGTSGCGGGGAGNDDSDVDDDAPQEQCMIYRSLLRRQRSITLNPLNTDRLMALFDRMNSTHEPQECDVRRLFHIAEQHHFNLSVHPEFIASRWPQSAANIVSSVLGCDNESTLMVNLLFNLEWFAPELGYVGSITLDSQRLKYKLLRHTRLQQRTRIVDDVCQLIQPLPPRLIRFIWKVLSSVGLEILYDLFGKFAFELYKLHLRKKSAIHDKSTNLASDE